MVSISSPANKQMRPHHSRNFRELSFHQLIIINLFAFVFVFFGDLNFPATAAGCVFDPCRMYYN